MSHLLFALFVNDIEDHLLANGCSYVKAAFSVRCMTFLNVLC